MGDTKIQWTDKTWNPIVGCTKVSEGCRNCYAETIHNRRHKASLGGMDVPVQYSEPFETVQLKPERLDFPLHWKKPRMIFVNSMSDLFHEDVPFEFIDKIFAVISMTPQHTFQILTKRPKRMKDYCADEKTPFRVTQKVDEIKVDIKIKKTAYEIRLIPGYDKYFIDNTGVVFTTHGSGHCVWCGTVFEHGQQDSIYCSQKCASDSGYARRNGRNHEPAKRIMRKVKIDIGDKGHCRVNIIGYGRELVHRLVLKTFDREPIGNEQSCHRDGNAMRNHICNLRWGTQADNWKDRIRHGNGHAHGENSYIEPPIKWPLKNCWKGISCENQATADERIPILLQVPAAVRFLSCEPLLDEINLTDLQIPVSGGVHHFDSLYCDVDPIDDEPYGGNTIDWVIVGGESGPGYRPMNLDWARSIRAQCAGQGVPFFFKQTAGKKEIPEDLQIREYPK